MVSCSLPFSKEKDKSIFAVFKQKSSSAVTENRAFYLYSFIGQNTCPTSLNLVIFKSNQHFFMKKLLPLFLFFFIIGCQKEAESPSVITPVETCPSHKLPVIYIDTNDIPIDSKEDYVEGTIEIIGAGNLEGLLEQNMKIKGRGNSTWWLGETWGKKPYQVKFSDKTALLGMPEDKKWVMLAELSDKSFIRNKIARDLSRMSDLEYTPALEYVEVVLNGQPQGVYLIGQKVEESDNRVAIGDDGYLIEIDNFERIDEDDVFFTSEAFTNVFHKSVFNIKEPSLEYDSDKYLAIENHIKAFETVLFSAEFDDPNTGYEAYIDVDSFIDWFLVNEIGKTQDAKFYSSIYFSYIPGGKIKMGPIWDFDLSFGNVNYDDPQFVEGFWIKENPWIKRLFEDSDFEQRVLDKFTTQYYDKRSEILGKIDCHASYIDTAQIANYEIWKNLGVQVWPNPVWFDTYQEEVDHLKNWISDRMDWLNTNL